MGLRILLIDNDRLILQQLEDGLREAGHDVFKAADGMEGLQRMREQKPDAVLLDLVLPKIDGFRFCKYVREDAEFARLPLIAVSAVSPGELQKAIESGATAAVAKEAIEDLLPKLMTLLEQFTPVHNNELPSTATTSEITKELLQERSRFLSLLNSLPEGLLELDNEHRVIYMNAAASRILEQPEATAAGKNFRELFEPSIQTSIGDMLRHLSTGTVHSVQSDFEIEGRTLRIALTAIASQTVFAGCVAL